MVRTTDQGFSLVELSIVLVILGLLVGGILSGQSLIRAAELRSISADYGKFYTASQIFRDKYFAVPGDMNNATTYWGKDNTYCAGHTGTVAANGTCNGNGDGAIDAPPAGNTTGEAFQLWRQLALAGLLEGSYTGVAGAASYWARTPGVNIPASKAAQGGWLISYSPNYAGSTAEYAYDYRNYLSLGTAAVLRAEEAWNIDMKIDDGKPGTGKMMERDYGIFNTVGGCTTSTSATDYGSAYEVSATTVSCMPYFPQFL